MIRPALLVCGALLVLCPCAPAPVLADDGAIEAVGGAVHALRAQPSITMIAEYVHAWLSPEQVKVESIFFLRNRGPATVVTVGYPNLSSGADVLRAVPFRTFSSFVDGVPVQTRELPDSTHVSYGDFTSWYVKEVAFQAGEVKCLRNEFTAPTGFGLPNYRSFQYILETGSTWADPIGVGDIVVDVSGLGAGRLDGVDPKPTSRTSSELRWHFTNLEPDKASGFSQIHVTWTE